MFNYAKKNQYFPLMCSSNPKLNRKNKRLTKHLWCREAAFSRAPLRNTRKILPRFVKAFVKNLLQIENWSIKLITRWLQSFVMGFWENWRTLMRFRARRFFVWHSRNRLNLSVLIIDDTSRWPRGKLINFLIKLFVDSSLH